MEQAYFGTVVDALYFAAQKHRHQRRKDADATPYINHPIGLLHLLYAEAEVADPVVLVGALLHDTVEDTETTLTEIQNRFGSEVAEVVNQVTDDKSLPKATRKQLQIEHAASLSDRAKLVKLADKISNLRNIAESPPEGWSVERRVEYCNWAKAVIDEIRGTHSTLESLFDQAYRMAVTAGQSSP